MDVRQCPSTFGKLDHSSFIPNFLDMLGAGIGLLNNVLRSLNLMDCVMENLQPLHMDWWLIIETLHP